MWFIKKCVEKVRKKDVSRVLPLRQWFKATEKSTRNVTFKLKSKQSLTLHARADFEKFIRIEVHIQSGWLKCPVSEYHSGLKTAPFCRTSKARTDHGY